MKELPSQYGWLNNVPCPAHLRKAISLYGLQETKGARSNPEILSWARELGGEVFRWYDADDKPWCGLFVAICLKRSRRQPPVGINALRALQYVHWGVFVHPKHYGVGDLATFSRKGGGHVGFLVGEDMECYHVLGGNQSDGVNIARIQKSRLVAVTRPEYVNFKPMALPSLTPSGKISENEA